MHWNGLCKLSQSSESYFEIGKLKTEAMKTESAKQSSLICASGERRSQALNVELQMSAGIFHRNLHLAIYGHLSHSLVSAGTFLSDLRWQAQNTFNEAW